MKPSQNSYAKILIYLVVSMGIFLLTSSAFSQLLIKRQIREKVGTQQPLKNQQNEKQSLYNGRSQSELKRTDEEPYRAIEEQKEAAGTSVGTMQECSEVDSLSETQKDYLRELSFINDPFCCTATADRSRCIGEKSACFMSLNDWEKANLTYKASSFKDSLSNIKACKSLPSLPNADSCSSSIECHIDSQGDFKAKLMSIIKDAETCVDNDSKCLDNELKERASYVSYMKTSYADGPRCIYVNASTIFNNHMRRQEEFIRKAEAYISEYNLVEYYRWGDPPTLESVARRLGMAGWMGSAPSKPSFTNCRNVDLDVNIPHCD